ncbi:MAG: phosphoglucosamine mutase [Acidimicrobiia bacterium]
MTLRFGTDGVRGVANVDLTPELVVALGRAAARVLGADRPFIVGRDTRRSGPMLQAALSAGLTAEGADVEIAGVLPTPAVAYLSHAHDAPGAMISASHNPFPDNGIKFFVRGGRKLTDDVEEAIEAQLDALLSDGPGPDAVEGAGVGTVKPGRDDLTEYGAHIGAALEGRRLDGIHVVADCANGAASTVAFWVLHRLGAKVDVRHAEPDGININAGCGATHPDALQSEVVATGAQVGLAFDGDADRLIAVDERGALVDGDHLLAIFALDRLRRGRLPHDSVVATVMANLGLRRAMAEHGIRLVETQVGDRYVLDAMEAGGFVLGGEQSGHIIVTDLATTGDGLLSGVVLLDVMARTGRPLSELASVVTKFPQVLCNVRVTRGQGLDEAAGFWAEVRLVEAELGDTGRVLVRRSGTEPVVRVMVEAATADAAAACADRLVSALTAALGAGGDA